MSGSNPFAEAPHTSDDLVSKKIEAIQAGIERKNREAERLLEYLQQQQEQAKSEEEEEEDALKKQGIIVGQHIPSLPSKLNLDPLQLAEFETFSSTVLVARDLLQQNRTNFLRRTGNLPISDLAESRRANQKTFSMQDSGVPHYLEMTQSAKTREERVGVRFAETVQTVKRTSSPTRKTEEAMRASAALREKQKNILSAKERQEHENVLKSINHKLNYLRNPRNDPAAVTKMLVKPKDFPHASLQQKASVPSLGEGSAHRQARGPASESVYSKNKNSVADHASAAAGGGGGGGGKGLVASPSRESAAMLSEDSSSQSSVSLASALKAKYTKHVRINNNPLFVCEPSHVFFMDFELGKKYTQSVTFRNISAVTRTVRVLPPKLSSVFSISPLKYPPNSVGGMVAPGMCVNCTLTFVPNALGDFEDAITVGSESGTTELRIKAQREPPNLSIPSVINLGLCLVGDAQRLALICTNTGGTGRFTVLERAEDAALIPADYPAHRCLRLAPFTIYPTQFELGKSESVELVFEFVPLQLGLAARQFVIFCDNGQVREFTLQATAKEINVSFVEINRVGFNDKDTSVYRHLHFDGVSLGAERVQSVAVVNDTGIPVEYEWVWLDTTEENPLHSTLDSTSHAEGQEIIAQREEEQRSAMMLESRQEHTRDAHTAAVDHSLLRSIKQSLDAPGSAHGDDAHHGQESNVARRDAFEIIPARGVLAGEGASDFRVVFSPQGTAKRSTLRAVMMIKAVPRAALPSSEQEEALRDLLEHAHGAFPRLLSWLTDMGTPVPVPRHRRPNGSFSSEKHVLSLSALLGLIVAHAFEPDLDVLMTLMGGESGDDDEEEIKRERCVQQHQQALQRFNRWVRNVLRHVFELRKQPISRRFAKTTAGSEKATSIDSEDGSLLHVFEWNTHEQESHGEPTVPRLLLPVRLFFEEDNRTQGDDEYDALFAEQEQRSSDPDLYEIIDEAAQNQRALPSLHDFLPEHRQLMEEIWLDTENALLLFGDTLSAQLNEKVQHEAIDFLKSLSLNNLAALQFTAQGMSTPQSVSVQPPCLEVSGGLSLGKEWRGEVQLTNHTDAPLQLQLNLQEIVVRKVLFSSSSSALPSSHNAHTTLENEALSDALLAVESLDSPRDFPSAEEVSSKGSVSRTDIIVQSDYERLLLMPHSTDRVSLSLCVHVLGRFHVMIPVQAVESSAAVESVQLLVTACGPKVRFEKAEVDLGLLGVGGESSYRVSFSNEGDVPVMFMLKPTLHVDNNGGSSAKESGSGSASHHGSFSQRKTGGSFNLGGAPLSSRPSSHREPLSARSGISRNSSTTRSDDFSVADSQASSNNGEFKIELKNAIISLEPNSGVLGPKSTQTITVITKAGKQPQRIRGMIENRVFDESGHLELTRQFINLRGEVQAPKILLYPMHHSLGQVFVGRSIPFSFTLENICNLPTKFKFTRPGGASSLYTYSLSPNKGSLDAKEKLTIHGTFTATATGMIDDVISCKLFGLPKPLGFVVKALAKGITLEFINASSLKEGEQVKPIAKPEDAQLPHFEKPPEPCAIQPLLLGDAVPLYERRSITFYIRNLSAIPAPFSIQPRKFCVMEKNTKGTLSVSSASVTSSFTRVVRKDLILTPQEDGVNKFQSAAGKQYIGEMIDRREDRKFLKSGFGASYLTDCSQGEIPPWGVQTVTVHAFNDIPGRYDDWLDVSLFENEVVRKFSLPIKMAVQGCPVVIEKSSLGMTTVSANDKHRPAEFRNRQLLSLGEACEHGVFLKREFFVRNNGSKVGRVRWSIEGIAADQKGPLRLRLSVSKDGKVEPSLRFWSDIKKESPFRIDPPQGLLKPYGKQRFSVMMTRNSPAGMERAVLTAHVTMKDEEEELQLLQASTSDDQIDGGAISVASSVDVGKPKEKFVLNLLVEGHYVHPSLVVVKHTHIASQQHTLVSPERALHLKAKATLLFSSGGKFSHSCSRLVTIQNPLESDIVMNVYADGPYAIKDVDDTKKAPHTSSSATIATVSSIGAEGEASSIVSRQSTTSGKTFHLLPHESSKFIITFNPKKNVREQLLSTFGTESGRPTEAKGQLIFAFPTGQRLHVPVVTAISTPFISGSSPRLYFGVCHVRHRCNALFLLSNPTDVPARWTVQHVPGGGRWKNTTAIRVKGFEQTVPEIDDPEVFSITPNQGFIEGPTVSVAAAMAAPPKDYNRKAEDAIVAERLVEASWATKTLSIADTLEQKNQTKSNHPSDALFPMPVNIYFSPKKNQRYCSRFRFSCEFANSFEVVLQGEGTFEEHEHHPLNPIPR